jgi:hypothetical protein
MPPTPAAKRTRETAADKYYRRALQVLRAAEVPVLIAGAYAMRVYTGIVRDTKDMDLFLRKRDLETALVALTEAGFGTELTYPHWLAKSYQGKNFVDIIFNMANGAMPIDDTWFAHAVPGELLGQPVLVLAAEEMISSKLLVLDRPRYDGADIAHLLRGTAQRLDWRRILGRAEKHWQVLLSHLVMFGYIYPGELAKIPSWVINELVAHLQQDEQPPPADERICRGTMLSPTQYLVDVEKWGYQDARLPPWGTMTPEEVRRWTEGVLAGK